MQQYNTIKAKYPDALLLFSAWAILRNFWGRRRSGFQNIEYYPYLTK